jgi:hypothetical protein
MHFTLFVAVHAHHSLLIMDIGCSAVFAGILGINPSTVTKGTGFSFVFLHKLMTFNQPQ